MKLQAEVNEQNHEIEIKRDGERVFARVDDREYDLEATEVEPNVYLLKHDQQIYQVYAAPNGIVNIGNHQLEVKLTDPKRLRGGSGAGEGTEGASEIKTAMPGKLVRILVEIGDEISKGDPVLVVEAMKMQNEMKAPKDGIVRELRFSEGSTVNAGDVLAVIE